jgi:hypothetical protein
MRAKRANFISTPWSVVKQRPSAQPERPADNILALVHVFSNLIGQAFYGPIQARHHLSVQHWRILLTLAHHNGATAAEIIALNAVRGALPITRLEGRPVGGGKPGPWPRRLAEALASD